MNIIEAMKAALDGNKIRRKDWHYIHYIYRKYPNSNNTDVLFGRYESNFDLDKYQNEEDKIYVRDGVVTLRVDDYIADDWEVVE